MKKTYKCLLCIVIGIILHTAIILIFVLTLLRTRAPKLRLASVSVQTLTTNSSVISSPSFAMKLNAQITLKNTYFGKFKFGDSTATISYLGYPIGEAVIGKGKVKARSTKKVDVGVNLSSEKVAAKSFLATDLKSGKLRLLVRGALKGKVQLLKVIKRKKTAEMSCYMDVITKTKAVENLHCD